MLDSAKYQIKLLFVVGPGSLYPDLMVKKLSEITVKMDRNWKVFVLSGPTSSPILAGNLPYSMEIDTLPKVASLKDPIGRILYFISCILKGVELVKRENINVTMCKGLHCQHGLIAYIISRLTNRKCIIRVSEDTLLPLIFLLRDSGNFVVRSETILKIVSLIYRRIESFLFRHVDWIVTHGPMDYEKIKRVTKRITFVPLWVDVESFKPLNKNFVKEFKRNLVGERNARILLFVGRLHPEKDVETLLRAFKIVSDIYEDVTLMIIGVDMIRGYEEEYKEMTRELKIAERTHFLGYIPNHELSKYYNIADVYILSSIREEWSNTLMEAMACKVPVIATEVGGNPYLVFDGRTGFLVPPKNPRELAKRIMFVLENPALALKVSEEALKEIQKYGKDRIGELYKSIIRNVIWP